jgi:bifunctional non-homologous end joining protein LigD
MLATTLAHIPRAEGWWMEPKYDGWRALSGLLDGVVMWTREGNHITQVPYIARMLAARFPAGTILDGEIVDLHSVRQWNRTQSILATTKGGFQHEPIPDDPPLSYVLFDMLCLGGEDLCAKPLKYRRAMLEEHLTRGEQTNGVLRLAPTQSPSEVELSALLKQSYEGVVVKRVDSTYRYGARSRAWGKIKPSAAIEAICTGVYDPEPGSKYAPIKKGCPEPWAVGGICFRVEHEDGRVNNGRAAGMNDKLRRELFEHPEKFTGLIVELAHWGIGEEGALRHPAVKRFRSNRDKATARTATLGHTV